MILVSGKMNELPCPIIDYFNNFKPSKKAWQIRKLVEQIMDRETGELVYEAMEPWIENHSD